MYSKFFKILFFIFFINSSALSEISAPIAYATIKTAATATTGTSWLSMLTAGLTWLWHLLKSLGSTSITEKDLKNAFKDSKPFEPLTKAHQWAYVLQQALGIKIEKTASGYVVDGDSTKIFKQYQLYRFPGFVDFLKKLPDYKSQMESAYDDTYALEQVAADLAIHVEDLRYYIKNLYRSDNAKLNANSATTPSSELFQCSSWWYHETPGVSLAFNGQDELVQQMITSDATRQSSTVEQTKAPTIQQATAPSATEQVFQKADSSTQSVEQSQEQIVQPAEQTLQQPTHQEVQQEFAHAAERVEAIQDQTKVPSTHQTAAPSVTEKAAITQAVQEKLTEATDQVVHAHEKKQDLVESGKLSQPIEQEIEKITDHISDAIKIGEKFIEAEREQEALTLADYSLAAMRYCHMVLDAIADGVIDGTKQGLKTFKQSVENVAHGAYYIGHATLHPFETLKKLDAASKIAGKHLAKVLKIVLDPKTYSELAKTVSEIDPAKGLKTISATLKEQWQKMTWQSLRNFAANHFNKQLVRTGVREGTAFVVEGAAFYATFKLCGLLHRLFKDSYTSLRHYQRFRSAEIAAQEAMAVGDKASKAHRIANAVERIVASAEERLKYLRKIEEAFKSGRLKDFAEKPISFLKNGKTIRDFSSDTILKKWGHVFSDQHLKDLTNKIMHMSKAQAEIANKIVDIIIKADEKELLRQGVNTIETIIDDCKMLLKVFIDTKGNVQNINGYPLISETARKLGNVITMLE